MFSNLFYQIYPGGIRHIRADKRVNEWKTPGKKNIVKCAVNQRQVCIVVINKCNKSISVKSTSVNEWKTPGKKNIVKCAVKDGETLDF